MERKQIHVENVYKIITLNFHNYYPTRCQTVELKLKLNQKAGGVQHVGAGGDLVLFGSSVIIIENVEYLHNIIYMDIRAGAVGNITTP